MKLSEHLQRNTRYVSKMNISARCTLCSVLQEKLQVKFSRMYHVRMKVHFADNQHKFDCRTTSALYILND